MKNLKVISPNRFWRYCRVFIGAVIALHGLIRVVFIDKYVDFVLLNFSELIGSTTILTTGAIIFPFIEFCTGLLIMFRLGLRSSIWSGILISVIMSAFIIAGDLYVRLIYHIIVVSLLLWLYLNFSEKKFRKRII